MAMDATRVILVINAGSSSHKCALYRLPLSLQPVAPLWKGVIEWQDEPQWHITTHQTTLKKTSLKENALQALIATAWQGTTKVIEGPEAIQSIGHRVVHGGVDFPGPALITPQVKDRIAHLIPLAPLHNQVNLQGIEEMETLFPHVQQFAVFDTSFHHTLPLVAKVYPLPYQWFKEGIQRYGFHGINHHYCLLRASQLLQKDPHQLKIINCHLGSGTSLCAIQGGQSVNTTMGFTPLEGLMMGTRCGSIDPAILLYLLRSKHMSIDELEHTLYSESGLKGLSGTADMRQLENQEDEPSLLAWSMYVYKIRAAIGAYLTQLEGADVISFTGGIGENDARVRSAICEGLQFFGVKIDQETNHHCQNDQLISSPTSTIQVLVIHAQEEWMIVHQINGLISQSFFKH